MKLSRGQARTVIVFLFGAAVALSAVNPYGRSLEQIVLAWAALGTVWFGYLAWHWRTRCLRIEAAARETLMAQGWTADLKPPPG